MASRDDEKRRAAASWQDSQIRDDDENRYRLTGLRVMLQKYVGEQYTKDYLKDEMFVLEKPAFQVAVLEARKNLNLTNEEPIETEDTTKWVIKHLSGSLLGRSHKDYEKYKAVFYNEIDKVLKSAGLDEAWKYYVGDYIVNQTKPKKPLFIFPKTVWIEEVNNDNEVLVRLKPGLRYEDYINAWEVVSKPLGVGKRLRKTRTNDMQHLDMIRDKERGLTYRQIALKHYPDTDPEVNVGRIKKIILRGKKRLNRDI